MKYKMINLKTLLTISAQSPHVKSDLLSGGLRSLRWAVTGPLFDFQGDLAQQGGTLILGPGELKAKVQPLTLVAFTNPKATNFLQ
jgi:hypothetical protein